MNQKITVIGGGNMGGALLEGFLRSGKYSKEQIALATPDPAETTKFTGMGVAVYRDNAEAVREADVVIIAVKPYLVNVVAADIRSELKDQARVVSIAAGLELGSVTDLFDSHIACFRVMPNIAAAYGASMSFVSCDKYSEKFADEIVGLFSSVGEAVVIEEKFMDSAMVSASCGLAFAIRYVRAAMEASIEMGLGAEMSRRIVAQTVKGACELLLNDPSHPEAMVDRVSTPGGLTIVGLNEMEHHGFTSSVIKGHMAPYFRLKAK